MTKPTKYSHVLDEAATSYTQATCLRAGIQLIPYVGSPLDTLLCGAGSKIREKRLDSFLMALKERLVQVENAHAINPDEHFFDLMMSTFDAVLRARSEAKRLCFVSLVANQVKFRKDWDEAETAVRLLSELTEQHIAVLIEMHNAPECKDPFEGLRVVTVNNSKHFPDIRFTNLGLLFPVLSERTLRIIISELISIGMVRDEGFGRLETPAMEYFVVTDLTDWLLEWINK